MEDKAKNQKEPIAQRTDEEISKDIKVDVTARMQNLFGENRLKPKALPLTTAETPYRIPGESGEIVSLGAPMVGSLTATDDKEDILRNMLRLAEAKKAKLLLVNGNVMYMLTQRYGSQRAYKTQVSGVRINAKKLQDAYPKAVTSAEGFQSVEESLQKGEPAFMTLRVRLAHTTDMLNEMFTDEKGKPLYSGPVAIVFGRLEDELIMHYANELLRVGLFKVRSEATLNYNKLKKLYRSCKNENEKQEMNQKMREFKEFLNIWAILGNIIDESVESARMLVAYYIVRKYESRIPNAKVISVGDAYLEDSDGHSVMVTADKGSAKSNGRLAAMIAAKVESFSKGRMAPKIPDIILASGLNPCFDKKFVTYQASDIPGDKQVCMIIQQAMCIDSERFRHVVRGQNILKDAITKVVQSSGFESGILSFQWINGIRRVEFWTSDVLKNKKIFKNAASLKDFLAAKELEFKMLYGHKEGCSHYGANDILLYASPNDPIALYKKYHQQVAKEFLLSCDAPIVMHQHDGDACQQMNHDYQKNVHPTYLLPEDLRKEMFRIMDSNGYSEAEKLKKIITIALEQKIRDGVLDFRQQVEGYVKSLEPHLEYFVRILKRGQKVKISFKGLFSAITHIAGNHNKNTFKKTSFYVSDAEYINDLLKKTLLTYLIKTNRVNLVDFVDSGLSSPHNGPLGEGRGALIVNGKSCYAMLLKHKQGAMDKTQARGKRRSQEHYEVGLPICNLSGDDHKGGVRVNRGIVHIKTGCQQGEGSFGREIDGSEQNVFSMVYGLPVGGFANGPLVFFALDYPTMRRYADKPFTVDRKKLFKNALE